MKYRVTSKKDCCIILEIFLYMINGKNYGRHSYKYIIDLEKEYTTDNE